MSRRDVHRWTRFLTSLGSFLLLVVAAPIGLASVSRSRFGSINPLAGVDPPWTWGSGRVGDAVSQAIPDDTVIDGIIRISLCVVWVAVVVIAVTTIIEVVHASRHRGLPMPNVRGLGWAQHVARFIAIGLIAILPTVTPAGSLVSALGASAAPSAAIGSAPSVATLGSSATPASSVSSAAERFGASSPAIVEHAAPESTTHVVRPGESVYSIALDLAGGNASSVIEIADAIIDANLGSSMPGGQRFTNPAYLEVGWILQIPDHVGAASRPTTPVPASDTSGPSTYVVEQGDTLWEIADEQLGDPTAWPEIWEENHGDDMGGGRTFDDPNLILPGWELELETATSDHGAGASSAAPESPQATDVLDDVAADPGAGAPDRTTAEPTTTADAHHADPTPDDAVLPSVPAVVATPDDPVPPSVPATTVAASGTPAVPVDPPESVPDMTSTTIVPIVERAISGGADGGSQAPSPGAPSPIRLEHAALLAAGILALVAVRRRQRLRAAMPRHRVPEPRPEVTSTERRLRNVDAGERALRVDVACRAAALALIDTGCQIGWIEVSGDGDVELRLTAPATLPAPWTGNGQSWRLGAEVPVEMISDDARQVGLPCVAMVQLGVTPSGSELLVDLEACGTLAVVARADQADEVVAAVAASLASSLFAEIAHLIGVSLPIDALLNHRNGHTTDSADAALELATSLMGTTALNERSTFELRSLRTGGEMWEPAVVLLQSADDGGGVCRATHVPGAGHGMAVVVADEYDRVGGPSTLRATADGWTLDAFGTTVYLTPIGVTLDDLDAVTEILEDAERRLEPIEEESTAPTDPTDELQWADDVQRLEVAAPEVPFEPMAYEVVVGLLGGVDVHARTGELGIFERSKTVELIAWLATHRDRATRSGARTALWELDVRDATFANVVSEARRALARLVAPPDGEEWVGRTLTAQLPLHELVVTDADLVDERLAHARLQPPSQALDTLRPAVQLIRDMPFTGTSYLWPDAEGITSNLVLLAITAAAEYAGHALSIGDTDGVFWATGQGLRVLAGHEELIALRMRAHARAGDLAGVRLEWESYERVLVADAWSDGEPAPKLLSLRRELLEASAS